MDPLLDLFSEEANVGTVERVISCATGAGLLTMAARNIKDPDIQTCLEIGAGLYLLYRGVTAFCPIKKVLAMEIESHS